ncbi:hypothetical protein AQI88_26105 [Streptomyces cellostaticus]|uniref:Uncharacterized protein n=1 Tax=Streptomyces cellostaticus TaxID=67285 RepID=A0A101NIK2_9ACTN|nr:hypothetical protein [Streptomyces cellostaticus]KUM93556.1 hypothetical protein AQI88_26105 [Streptomyces cellostaticus]GHI04313.1 hypothetical protein Scel_26340 [Streptomyces cellostaticus]
MSFLSRRRTVRLSQHRTADSPFGPVRISYNPGPAVIALVQGPGMPPVTVVPGRDHGQIKVDGQVIPMRRGNGNRWALRRRSRTRTAVVRERTYELRPTSLRQARLLRNGTPIAEAHGTLRSYASLRDIPGIDARLTWSHGLDPTDVAIGQAMVLAFGAGAPGALASLAFSWLGFS